MTDEPVYVCIYIHPQEILICFKHVTNTAGLASNCRLVLIMLAFLLSLSDFKPRPVLDFSSKTIRGMYFRFFWKISKWARLAIFGDFGDFGSRIDFCPRLLSFSDNGCYVRKTSSSCLPVYRFFQRRLIILVFACT